MAKPGNEKGRSEAAALRRSRSMSWRLQGLSLREIGKREDISHEQARLDVGQFLREVLDIGKEEAEELRALENARLDALWERFFPVAIGDVLPEDPRFVDAHYDAWRLATQACLKISKARRELNGLDMPVKVEVTGEVGLHPIQDKMEGLTEETLIALAGDKGVVVPMKLIEGKKAKAK